MHEYATDKMSFRIFFQHPPAHRRQQLQSLSDCTDSCGAVLWNCHSQLNELSLRSDLVLCGRAGKWASSNPYTSLWGYSASLLEKCFILGSQTKKGPCVSLSANVQWRTEYGKLLWGKFCDYFSVLPPWISFRFSGFLQPPPKKGKKRRVAWQC